MVFVGKHADNFWRLESLRHNSLHRLNGIGMSHGANYFVPFARPETRSVKSYCQTTSIAFVAGKLSSHLLFLGTFHRILLSIILPFLFVSIMKEYNWRIVPDSKSSNWDIKRLIWSCMFWRNWVADVSIILWMTSSYSMDTDHKIGARAFARTRR
jgi:hypothetical protein